MPPTFTIPSRTLSHCEHCKEKIYPLERANFLTSCKNREWHVGCAKCGVCHTTLSATNFAVGEDGRLLCKVHYMRGFMESGGKYAIKTQENSENYIPVAQHHNKYNNNVTTTTTNRSTNPNNNFSRCIQKESAETMIQPKSILSHSKSSTEVVVKSPTKSSQPTSKLAMFLNDPSSVANNKKPFVNNNSTSRSSQTQRSSPVISKKVPASYLTTKNVTTTETNIRDRIVQYDNKKSLPNVVNSSTNNNNDKPIQKISFSQRIAMYTNAASSGSNTNNTNNQQQITQSIIKPASTNKKPKLFSQSHPFETTLREIYDFASIKTSIPAYERESLPPNLVRALERLETTLAEMKQDIFT
jgi:hypothetical protein